VAPPGTSLSEAEARERLRQDGPYALPGKWARSLWTIAALCCLAGGHQAHPVPLEAFTCQELSGH